MFRFFCLLWWLRDYKFSNVKNGLHACPQLCWPVQLTSSYLSVFDDIHLFNSCSAKVNVNSLSIDSKGYTTMVNFCLKFIGKECLIYTIKGFRKDKFHKTRVSMGLTVSRKTAKNLAVRRKNERIFTVTRSPAVVLYSDIYCLQTSLLIFKFCQPQSKIILCFENH